MLHSLQFKVKYLLKCLMYVQNPLKIGHNRPYFNSRFLHALFTQIATPRFFNTFL